MIRYSLIRSSFHSIQIKVLTYGVIECLTFTLVLNSNLEVSGVTPSCTSLQKSRLIVNRYLSGIGQDRGGLVVRWRNISEKDIEIAHVENLPHFMKIFLSNMKITDSSSIKKIIYSPAKVRTLPNHMEMSLIIPAGKEITLEVPFERDLLRYTDYPFDANRGFDLAGATIEYHDGGLYERIVTPTILLTMPVPDFTMPYNVITLTSTLIVLFYGTFFNLSYRRFYTGPTLMGRLRNRVMSFIRPNRE